MALTFADVFRGIADSTPQLVNLFMQAKQYNMQQEQIDNQKAYQEGMLALKENEIIYQSEKDASDTIIKLDELEVSREQAKMATEYYKSGRERNESERIKIKKQFEDIETMQNLREDAGKIMNELLSIASYPELRDRTLQLRQNLGVVANKLKLLGTDVEWLTKSLGLEQAGLETQIGLINFVLKIADTDDRAMLNDMMNIKGTTVWEVLAKGAQLGIDTGDIQNTINEIKKAVIRKVEVGMKNIPKPIGAIPILDDTGKLKSVQKVDLEDNQLLYKEYLIERDRVTLESLSDWGVNQYSPEFKFFMGMFSPGFQQKYEDELQDVNNTRQYMGSRELLTKPMGVIERIKRGKGYDPLSELGENIYGKAKETGRSISEISKYLYKKGQRPAADPSLLY